MATVKITLTDLPHRKVGVHIEDDPSTGTTAATPAEVWGYALADVVKSSNKPCPLCDDTGRIEHPNISGHDYSEACKCRR